VNSTLLAILEDLAKAGLQLGEAWWASRTPEQKSKMEGEAKWLLFRYLQETAAYDPNPTDPNLPHLGDSAPLKITP
jgi:hypothetical protein